MEINTRFNIGDVVYMATGLSIMEYRIVEISIKIYKTDDLSKQVSQDILYTIVDKSRNFSGREYGFKLFKTKEKCKEDMIDRINKL